MPRPRRVAAWEAEALALGLMPKQVRQKMTTLRAKKAGKYGRTIPEMEAVFGWDLDDMAATLIHAYAHLRCRGPRCGRRPFREFPLELITCDILNPQEPPLWCVNVAWACSSDNKGDRDRPLGWRIENLIKARTVVTVEVGPAKPEQLGLWAISMGGHNYGPPFLCPRRVGWT